MQIGKKKKQKEGRDMQMKMGVGQCKMYCSS